MAPPAKKARTEEQAPVATPDAKLLGHLVGERSEGAFALLANGLLALVGRETQRKVNLQHDETYQGNVKFIQDMVGKDVTVTTDMPPIHEHIGLEIGNVALLRDMDAAMKAGMKGAVQTVKKKQQEQGGYISWKKLQEIFDGDCSAMFRPRTEDDKMRSDSIVKETGLYFKFDGSPDMSQMGEAEELMKKVVADGTIWDFLKIDTNLIRKIFAAEGVDVSGFTDLFVRSKKCGHVAIDVGVVRFPRMEDPYFKLYRFRVIVFRSETAVLCVNKKGSGIFCEFRERSYNMTEKFSAKFTPEIAQKVHDKFEEVMEGFI